VEQVIFANVTPEKWLQKNSSTFRKKWKKSSCGALPHAPEFIALSFSGNKKGTELICSPQTLTAAQVALLRSPILQVKEKRN